MGEKGIAWVANQPGYGALGITLADRVVWTPLVEELLVSPHDDPDPLLTPLSGGSG
jgi:hypothetical protein